MTELPMYNNLTAVETFREFSEYPCFSTRIETVSPIYDMLSSAQRHTVHCFGAVIRFGDDWGPSDVGDLNRVPQTLSLSLLSAL